MRILAGVLCTLLVASCSQNPNKSHQISNLYKSAAYDFYTWQHGPKGQLDLTSLPESHHPLKEVGELFFMIRDSEEITEDAVKYADAMIVKYHLDQPHAVMKYPIPAKNLPANWHTAMAELMLSMILLDMGDALERSDYTSAGVKLFESTTRDMSEGGTVARDAEGCHLVEYADETVPASKNVTVLNGMLHSLITVFHLQSRAAVAATATDLYRCARSKAEVIGRAANGNPYPYYQLNPKEVLPVYYLIFEVMEYRTLYTLTNDQHFKSQQDYRENLLRMAYPVQYRKFGKEFQYIVSLISFPHPYAQDTFYTTLTCIGINSGKQYKVDNVKAKKSHDRMRQGFLRINAREKLTQCSLTSDYERNSLKLFSMEPTEVDDRPIETVATTIRASFDAKVVGNIVTIDPAILSNGTIYENMALIDVDLERPVHLNLSELVSLKICATKNPLDITNLRIANPDGKVLQRYWPSIKGPSCKIVPISPVGFHEYQSDNFFTISTISFLLGTSEGAPTI